MKFLILFTLIVLVTANVSNKNDCEGIVVNGVSHENETLKDNIDYPSQLTMDYENNILYFNFLVKGGTSFSLGYINLKSNDFGTVKDVYGAYATAIDVKTHTVYIGGSDGLYKLDLETKRGTNLNVTDKNIWQMFYKDGVYFTTYSEEEAYLYKDGQVERVPELKDTHVVYISIDKNHNIFFSNSSGIFYYTKDERKTTDLGNYIANGISCDKNGKIYFSTAIGIFSLDEYTKEVKKLARISSVYGMAVENDDTLLYASKDRIIRLKSSGKICDAEV